MVRKLKIKFILASTGALAVVMLMIMGLTHFLSYTRVVDLQTDLLSFLIENDGEIPEEELSESEFLIHGLSGPESIYEVRFFAVRVDREGEIIEIKNEHIRSVRDSEIREMVQAALQDRSKTGLFTMGQHNFVYMVGEMEEDERLVVFVESTSKMWIFKAIIEYMWAIYAAIFAVFVPVITIISGRLVENTQKNMEKQKQFITNAGHELKTPLAVISANTEMIEMLNGQSEWTQSTIRQTRRMTGLVNELIVLARLEEKEDVVLEEVDLSPIVKEQASSFLPLAERENKRFSYQVEEGIVTRADARGVREISSIFLDNAVKYCDEGGQIELTLKRRSRDKGARLTVSNSYAGGADIDTKRFFERFYRADQSHNSEKKGYGIGLSMAQGMAERMKGRLSVSWEKGMISFTLTL